MVRAGLVVLVLSCLLPLGCQTTSGGGDEGEARPPRRGETIPFEPSALSAPLVFESGSYPSLFDPSSRSTWLQGGGEGGDGGTMGAQARMMAESFLVFECRVVSAFEDSSIAYDAAGLRGIQVSLLAPDGTEIPPTKVMLEPDLRETARGALREYARTVYVLFPRVGLQMRIPGEGEPYQPLKLVMSGHGTVFAFSWPGAGPAEVRRERFRESDAADAIRSGYEKSKDASHELLHTFD